MAARGPALVRLGVPLLVVAMALPALWLAWEAVAGFSDTEPVRHIQHVTGLTALSLLVAGLALTPLRRLGGPGALVRFRRPAGLGAFTYAALHLVSYVVFDQELSPSAIMADVAKHPWVMVGFASFLLLVPLALTSADRMVRRLGGRRWQRLHRLVYPAAVLAGLHFLWLVKRDVHLPVLFLAALGLLLGARVAFARGEVRRSAGAARAAAPRPDHA